MNNWEPKITDDIEKLEFAYNDLFSRIIWSLHHLDIASDEAIGLNGDPDLNIVKKILFNEPLRIHKALCDSMKAATSPEDYERWYKIFNENMETARKKARVNK